MEIAHAHIRERDQVRERVFGHRGNQEQDEHHDGQFAAFLESVEFVEVFRGNHIPHERRAQTMNHCEHKRARDDASEQDDRGTEPGAIHHALCHLNDLTGNERHDDLHELHSQKDEKP